MKKVVGLMAMFLFKYISAQNVNYKTVYDDPNKIPPLMVTLDLLYLDMWGANFANTGFGIRADYRFKKLFTVSGSYRVAGLVDPERKDLQFNLGAQPKGGVKKTSFTEIVGYWHIKDETSSDNLKVVLSSSESGGIKTTKYIMAPGHKRKILSLHGGFYQSSVPTNCPIKTKVSKQISKSPYYLFNPSTQEKINLEVWYDPVNPAPSNIKQILTGTNTYANVLVFGFSHRIITNLKIKMTSSERNRRSNLSRDIYFDLLYAPVIKFDGVVDANGNEYEVHNDEIKKIGWRVGYCWMRSSRSSITFKTELASRPGVKGGNVAFFMSMGWTIPFKLGVKPEEKP
jgi:hypothetical protein